MQLEAAHRWPRKVDRFLAEAIALATVDKETAQSCMYTLPPRVGGDGKAIVGPSVRLAEMCASSWGNLHTGARVIDETDKEIIAQAVAWDLEKNLRVSIEVQRGILTSSYKGQPPRKYGADMIRVTGMAAISIALRNAIFRVIPRALINTVYDAACTEAVAIKGDPKFDADQKRIVGYFIDKWKVSLPRLLVQVSAESLEAMTREQLITLAGIGTAIKNGERTIEDAFPRPVQAVTSKGSALDALTEQHKAKSEPPKESDTGMLTAAQVHATLADVDDAWVPERCRSIVESWSPAEQRIAYDWAVAFAATPDNEAPPEQPEFTLIERQMGED